jgi:hypothetical protein
MVVLETEWWSLLLPPEWEAEEDEDGVVLIGDSDGVGCIEVSELRHPQGHFSLEETRSIAAAEEGPAWRDCRVGPLQGVCRSLSEEDVAIREWMLYRGPLLLYITYSCDSANAGMDDAAVDEILTTLAVNPDILAD